MKRIFFLLIFACIYIGVNGQVTYLDSSFHATGVLALNNAGGEDHPMVSLTRSNGKSIQIGYSYFTNRFPDSTLTTVTVVQFDLNGHPDPTFGQNGIVVLDQLKNDASAADAVLQPDGKLLITGKYLNSTVGPHHFVVRLNEDGSLDGSFGGNGVAGHPDPGLVVWGNAVAVQADGKIVMGGSKFTFIPPGSGYLDFALIRFNSNGLVDSSFGIDGVVTGHFPPGDAEGLSVALDGESRIYLGGLVDYHRTLLVRYLPDGSLDVGFGILGAVTIANEGGGVSNIVIQDNGQLIIGGGKKGWEIKGFIYRLFQDGTIDTSFEDPEFEGYDHLCGLASEPNGQILAGSYNVIYNTLKVFRFNSDGNLDSGFPKSIALPSGFNLYTGLSFQPDSKIIMGGAYKDEFLFQDFIQLRLTETIEVDSSYGVNGFSEQNFGSNYSYANALLLDDQKRILVNAAATYIDGTSIVNLPNTYHTSFVSRFQPDGSLDHTFSTDGLRPLSYEGVVLNLSALQPDGKIITAGATSAPACCPNLVVDRSLPDGVPDTTFGPFGTGFASEYFDENVLEAYTNAIAISQDSSIIVMGKLVWSDNHKSIFLERFDSYGLSATLYTHNFQVISDNFQLTAGLVQPDGKILVTGTFSNPVPNIFLVRFLPDGTLDNTFGTDGVVLKPFTGLNYRPNALALQPDGKIVLCGNQGGINVLVGRLNPDGTKDLAFSEDGLVLINTGSGESGNAMALQSDGKVVIAGWNASSSSAIQADPMVMRLLPTGVLDSSFAGTGYVITNLPGANQLNALAIQSDGSYITAGYSNNDYLLIRYLSKLNVGLLAEPAIESELLVYPNPVRGQVAFAYTLSTQSNVSVELFDMQGKRCQSFLLNENRPQGEQTEYLNFSKNLTPGVYTLWIQAGKGSRSVQVLVVE